jgi:hypothetical protein
MMTAKPGDPNEQAARDNGRPMLLAAINLALLALSAFITFAPQVPQPIQLLGRLLAFVVVLEWAVTLLGSRMRAPRTLLQAQTPRPR